MSVIYDPMKAASASQAGEGVTSLPSPALPSVVTPQERGRRGWLQRQANLEARYGKAGARRVIRSWARMGGRPKNPTWDDLMKVAPVPGARNGARRR